MDDQSEYTQAMRRVRLIKAFYIHLFIYAIVNAGLFLINILTSPDQLWFYFPLLGWGIGLVVHGLSVFGIGGMLGPEWEQKKIKEIMKKKREE